MRNDGCRTDRRGYPKASWKPVLLGPPQGFRQKLALDLRRLWAFLEVTQQETLNEYKDKELKTALPKQIARDIETFGIIKVLRENVNVDNIHVSLFYPKPSAADSEASNQKDCRNTTVLFCF